MTNPSRFMAFWPNRWKPIASAQLCRTSPCARGPTFSDGSPVTPEDVHLVLRDAGHPGQPALCRRMGQDRQVRDHRPAHGALHLQHRRPRTAADPRPAPDPEEGAVGGEGFHPILARRADRIRPLHRRPSSSRAASSPIAGTPTGGARTCPSTAASTISTRCATTISAMAAWCSRRSRPATITSYREANPAAWASNYAFPAVQSGDDRPVRNPASAPLGDRGLRDEHPQAAVRRTGACARR